MVIYDIQNFYNYSLINFNLRLLSDNLPPRSDKRLHTTVTNNLIIRHILSDAKYAHDVLSEHLLYHYTM